VFAASHLANAPIAMWAAVRLGVATTVLTQPVSNPFVECMIRNRGDAPECDTVPREGSMRGLVRALARGRSIAIVPDLRYEEGELVPFFGIPTPTVTTPARLALRFGCELVPTRVERLDGAARFRVTFHEAVRPRDPSASASEQALDMTRQLNATFEQWIRERPEQWITARRRWPRRAPAAVELARALG
jgi:KDO2-lipid IV(A) lauroyltransferase